MWFQRWYYLLPLRWRSVVRRRQAERDLDDEIQYHLDQQVVELVARGVGREEAGGVRAPGDHGSPPSHALSCRRASLPPRNRASRAGRTSEA